MEASKKTWEKPQLIVLARGTPEESVLQHCKTMNPKIPSTGKMILTQTKCASGDLNNCSPCQDRGMGDS
jgi:hypothetical protein